MIAQTFQDTFEEFYNSGEQELSEKHEQELSKGLNLVTLYERFIKIKFYEVRFGEKKPGMNRYDPDIAGMIKEKHNEFIKTHKQSALYTLFKEDELENLLSEQEVKEVQELIQHVEEAREKTGIIYRIIDGKPHFVHRTFAEYFAAGYLSEGFEQNFIIIEFLLSHIFKTENKVIRVFFDQMLSKDEEAKNQYEIHNAVLNNDENKVRELLSDKQRAKDIINNLDKGGRTGLHLAASYGYSDIVQVLLEHDPGIISTKDEIFHWSPLSYADKLGHWGVAELLLKGGANGNDMFEAISSATKKEKEGTLLHVAAKEGYIKFIEVLVQNKANIDARDEYGRTPLHVAAVKGKLDVVKYLVKKGANVNARDNSGWTPLQMPAASNALEIVKYLVENRADVNISDTSGRTPLYRAVEKSAFEVVKYLVENGADVNIRDPYKITPLFHKAVERSSSEVVEYLAKKTNIININAPHEGCTPLQRAADLDRWDIVKCLLNEGADWKGKERDGLTLPQKAAYGQKWGIVQFLLKNGADVNNTGSKGETLLYIAAEQGELKVVEKLIKEGANVNPSPQSDGPLHIAAAKGHLYVVKHLAGAKSLDKGKKKGINAKGSEKRTPVYRAVEGGHLDVVKYLVNAKGANFKLKSDHGTPLLLAAKEDYLNIVKFLIEKTFLSESKGIYPDKKGRWHKTAVKFAALGEGDLPDCKSAIKRLKEVNQESYSKVLEFLNEIERELQKENSRNLDGIIELKGNFNSIINKNYVPSEECIPSTSGRKRREVNAEKCLFTWEDVDEFNVEEDEKRDFDKINIDSDKFINYIKDLSEEKRSQLIQLADEVQVTGRFRGLVNKLTSNPKVMNHLNRVGKISGITMHGMMAKNVLADFLNGNYQGVAINVGFIAGGQGFAKVAEAASIKGLELSSEGKLLLGRSLKAASPFLARGTSAFVVYDLINQVKEFKNGTEEALVGIVGDGIYLGVDAAEIGIEIAEAFEIFEGISSVTGPIGATIGAVVFVGTDVYMAVKRVDKINEIIHLTGKEKFVEGLRAFIGMQPEQYIKELIEEKQFNNQLVNQGLEYLQQHSDIQRYVFPTGKQVKDSCSLIPYETTECIRTLGLDGGRCLERKTVTKYYQECTTKFQVDLNNEVLLDKKRQDIKWSRTRPDDPNGEEAFCLPQGDDQLAPTYGSYLCESAIGVTDLNRNKTGNYTLINLGEGNDYAKGFVNSGNIFVVNDGFKKYYGGNKDDIFILQGSAIKGYLSGEAGVNTLDLTSFAPEEETMSVRLDVGRVEDYYQDNSFGISGINRFLGRKDNADKVFIACDSDTSDVKFIDGQGGSERFKDQIEIYDKDCGYEMQTVIRPNTVVYNRASEGNFYYTIPYGFGSAKVDFIYTPEVLNVNNTFTFEYQPVEIKNIDVRNINVLNKTSHIITFNFSPKSNKEFNITISGASNPAYKLGSSTEIKVGDKGNLYMLQNTNQSVDEIMKSYLSVANRLNKMSFFIQSLPSNETVVIGSGNYEVIHNNPLHKSHLVGNGGENIYVIDSRDKKLDRLSEVVIYDLDVESSVDTIDLRNLVQQANKFSNKDSLELKVVKSGNDLLLKAEVTELKKAEDSSVSEMKKHEYFTVRLKDGVNLYNKTHVIVNNVPMGINFDNNEWSLKPLPLVFEEDKEVIIVTNQDIEEGTELITPKRAGNYMFVRDNGSDLMITNVFDADVAKDDLCTIVLSKFYEISKMETLSIKFADKEIILKDYQEQISTARDVNVVKKEYKDQVYNDVFNNKRNEISPEVMSSDQPMGHKHRHEHSRQRTRHRRHHQHLSHEELNNQPSIATSSAGKASSWINDLFSWAKSAMGGLFNTKAALAEEKLDTTSSILQVNAQIDVNSTIMLLDLLIRKVTDQKYISAANQPVPLLEARGHALNITTEFEKALKDTAKRSGVSANKLSFDFLEVYKAIEGKIISGELSKIPNILYSAVEEAYSKNERFMSILKSSVEKMLNEEQIAQNRDSNNQKESIDIPLSSLNSIAIEPLNNRKGITYRGSVK